MSREYVFVDEWDVDAPADAVFDALADARTYPEWWKPVYIRTETDGPPEVGRVSRQLFKGRLPYKLKTTSEITALERPTRIEAKVVGDLGGYGIWTLMASERGTHVRFDWRVNADRALLRYLTPVLRPLFRWNHNWAIARAMEGLEPYARRTRGGAMGSEDLVRQLQDRIEIEKVGYLYGRALDGRNPDLYDQCLTEDVRVEYPHGTWQGLEQHKANNRKTAQQAFNWTHHVYSNPLIAIDGDTATAQWYVTAWHGMPGEDGEEIVAAGALYDQELVRTPAGWRIARHVCTLRWTEDGGMVKDLSERVRS